MATGTGYAQCGGDGYTTSDIRLTGWQQTINEADVNDSAGNFKLYASAKKTGADGQSVDCSIQFNETSKPQWTDNQGTFGLGWKILTKATFNHFVLAAKNVDIRKQNIGLPDTHDTAGNPFLIANGDGTIDVSGLSKSNVDAINNGIDTIVR